MDRTTRLSEDGAGCGTGAPDFPVDDLDPGEIRYLALADSHEDDVAVPDSCDVAYLRWWRAAG